MKFSFLLAASSSILMAACGGGGSGSTDATQGAAVPAPTTTTPTTSGTPNVPATQASVNGPAASRWTYAAGENQSFNVSSGSLVRYGVGNTWIERSHTGPAVCSNGWFGSDPVPNQVKQCETLSGAAATTVSSSSTGSSSSDWTWVAAESGVFTINGTSNVRYGVDGAWAERAIAGWAECSNGTFGGDPAPGQVKRCEAQGTTASTPAPAPAPAPAPTSGWTLLAAENAAFNVSSAVIVRYGVDGAWTEKTIAGSALCSNGTFGGDPVPGQVKRCETQGSAPVVAQTPAPAPAPAPAPPAPAPAPAAPAVAATLGNTLGSARIMISGHSLTDDPLGDYMSAIAGSLNTPMWWNEQIAIGSTVRARTSGGNESDPTFPGYRSGKNRNGSTGLNIVSEFLNPQTLGGQRYDTLLLTERHDIPSTLVWEDTVRFARHYHDRLVAGNANANSYLYHAWQGVNDKSNPGSWINYERTVAPAWQCTAARINESLAGVGRSDRMAYLPAGLALANLVEQSVYGYVAGVSGGTAYETMSRLFTDDVHMTSTGMYYMALVSYASIYRRSPIGAWAPADVSPQTASSLQQIAWQSVANYYASASTPSMPQCQSLMRDQVCPTFANYKNLPNALGGCVAKFSSQSQDNPFYYDAGSDSGYWFAPPP